jgi:hypothetical protein
MTGQWQLTPLQSPHATILALMFTLDKVVPWGRSFDEYSRMFSLTRDDLAGRVVGCADGPACFNAEATQRGTRVVSCDPIYAFSASEIRSRIAATSQDIIEQTRQNQHEFVWTSIASPDKLLDVRLHAMELFLADYDVGRAEGRYVAAELPLLPFDDRSFDLAVCSHFLFLYSQQLGEAFHHTAIKELCRVAKEVRIFPLLALGGIGSSYVSPIAHSLRQLGYTVSIERVPYEFQRGANKMMRIVAAE